MVQKSGDHQLRLVNYPIIYKGSFSSQLVQDFFPPKVTVAKNVKFEHKFWDGKMMSRELFFPVFASITIEKYVLHLFQNDVFPFI